MDNHRDEHIACADCGASFLFSASEANVFQERGLAAPKRCKDCRRARKERGGAGDGARGPRGNGAYAGGAPRAPRFEGGPRRGGPNHGHHHGPPRYTGDVNEYRSPMQDGNSWQSAPWQGRGNTFAQPQPQPQRAPRRGGPGVYRDDGHYRAPSGRPDGVIRHERPERPERRERPQAAAAAPAPRRRPQAETFSITCNSCGSAAEVPFKPAEGREVFCQACYRARKPPV